MIQRLSKKIFSRAVLIAMALSLLSFTVAFAASGDLDATFGDGGKVTTDLSGHLNDAIFAVAIQSNGRIVVAGDRYNNDYTTSDFAVARYRTNGNLDTSFSGDGKLTTSFGGRDQAVDVAIQSDGKIVVGGQKCAAGGAECDLAVARYTTAGSLDTTFNSTGKKTVAFGGGDNGSLGGIAVQSDGKIVVGGYMVNSAGNYDFAVYRLKSNGALDTTFSGDGKAYFGFGSGRNDYVLDLLLQGSKIVVVGQTCDEIDANCNFALARLTSSGALDTTFSSDGLQTTSFGADDRAYSVALQSDGKLVVAGDKVISSKTSYCAVARYSSSGSLDTTFGSSGKKTLPDTEGCRGVAVKSSRILVAAYVSDSGETNFGLVRLKSNGALDTAFGGDGMVTIDFGGDDYARGGVILQSDGKYVIAGSLVFDGQRDFAVARVLP